jgi:hypothetical protein
MNKKMIAKGTFDVTMQPQESAATGSGGIRLGRQKLTKSFDGDLNADSKGEMLTAFTTVEGSAGYVAIEQVEGTLKGKKGRFVLQHYGTMQRGSEKLILEVVPDSGSGELEGINGSMEISVTENIHRYTFTYEL